MKNDCIFVLNKPQLLCFSQQLWIPVFTSAITQCICFAEGFFNKITLLINIKREWEKILSLKLQVISSVLWHTSEWNGLLKKCRPRTWFYLLVVDWMEADINLCSQPIIRSFSRLNNWRSLEYVTKETISLEDQVMIFLLKIMRSKNELLSIRSSTSI